MKKIVRFCALLVTVCMVLALVPVSVFAATKISAVTVLDLDEPVLGGTPDCDITVSTTPANAMDAWRVDWYMYDKETGVPEPLDEDYCFAAGDEVYAYVQILAKGDYTFGERGTDYTGAVNMRNQDPKYPAQVVDDNLFGVYTKDFVIVSEASGEEITAVAVTDLDAPEVGATPDFTATVTTQPADALAETEVLWGVYQEETQETLMLGADHVFAAGEQVVALIYAVPAEGYIFGAPLDTYKGTVVTPYMEENVLHEVRADGSMYIYVGAWTMVAETVIEFVDVPEGEWYAEPVDWAVKNGVTTGVDETHFAPDEGCTRAQAVTFLWRAAGKPEPTATQCTFVDVDVNAYYYEAVLWAVEMGITTGVDATHFEPDATCTRAHIVTFLYRALKGDSSGASSTPFVDVPAGEWYTEPVVWAAAQGITTGVDATHFEPENTCTRSQIVTFIYRAME